MSVFNSRRAYGWAAIALHWIVAVSILLLYLNGEAIEHAVGRAGHIAAVGDHASLGMALLGFMVLRVLWTLFSPKPDPLPQHPALRLLSLLVHWALLATIVVAAITGPLAIWALARPLTAYDWVSIPSPFPSPMRDVHEACEKIHGLAAHLFIPLVALHVLGALKHLVIDRDRTLQRMLWVRRGD